MATCPKCSWENAEEADTCLACGSALQTTHAAAAAPSVPATAPHAASPQDDERELRRAAQRARREREEAHRAAMRQAVDSGRQAQEVAARVAALVVQAGATQIEAEETIHRVRVASDATAGTEAATAVRPTKDAPQPYRPRSGPAPPSAATELKPGEAPCPLCGTGNDERRRFCRRCGQRFGVDAPAPTLSPTRWWSRLAGWWHAHAPKVQIWPEGHPPPSPRSVLAGGAVIVAGVALLGPWQISRTNIREHLFPRPRYVKPDRVAVDPKGLYDGFNTPLTIAGGATVHFTFDGRVDLLKVGIEAGATIPGAVTPDQLTLTIPGRSRPCTLLFTRNSGFQSYTCKASRVTGADLRVVVPSSGTVQVNEVEFFERS